MNEMLTWIPGLAQNFIAVNPATSASKGVSDTSINGVKNALHQIREVGPLCIFPSGRSMSSLLLCRTRVVSLSNRLQTQHPKNCRRLLLPAEGIPFGGRDHTIFDLLVEIALEGGR